MYTGITQSQCKLLIEQQVKTTRQQVEIEADIKAAKAQRVKATKDEKLREQKQKREAQAKDADATVTAGEMQAALAKQKAAFDAQMQQQGVLFL